MSSKRARVLVVDYNPRVRSFLKPALEEAGFDCVEAEDEFGNLSDQEYRHRSLVN